MSRAELLRLHGYWVSLSKPRRWRPAALPTLPLLHFLLVGIVPIALSEFDLVNVWQAVGIGLVGAGFGFWGFAVSWRDALGCTLTGLVLTAIHVQRPWNSYRRLITRDGSYVEAEVVLTDTGLTGRVDLEWLNPSKRVWARVSRMRVRSTDPWESCNGRVQLCLDGSEGMSYGNVYRIKGALRNPISSSIPHGFDQTHYLKLKGVEHCLYVIESERLGISVWRRPMGSLLALRGFFLTNLLDGVGDQRRKGMLAAVVFGMKQGVDSESKRMFLRSGMIHLFAVSGLHVGILSTIVMLALNLGGVSYRVRYALLPCLLLAFVLMTGSGVSAMRAWLMISIWAMGKSMMKPSVPLNAVFVAAFLLLLMNPLAFMTIGFQFSFVLVISILSAWRLLGMLWSCIGIRSALVPGRAQRGFRKRTTVYKMAFFTVGTMLIFWLAGLGLSVHFNQFINPMGLVSNVCVTVVAWSLMAVSWVKISFELLHVPFLPDTLAILLSWLTQILDGIAEFASSDSVVIRVGHLGCWWLPTYFCTIGVLVFSPIRVGAVLARVSLSVVLILVAIIWNGSGERRMDVFAVSGSDAPVICIRDDRQCILINAGMKGFNYALSSWLEGEGIRRVNQVIALDATTKHCGALLGLAERICVDRVDVIDGRRPAKKWTRTLVNSGVDIRHGALDGVIRTRCRQEKNGRGYVVEIESKRLGAFRIELYRDTFGGGVLEIHTDKTLKLPLWYRSDNELIASLVWKKRPISNPQ